MSTGQAAVVPASSGGAPASTGAVASSGAPSSGQSFTWNEGWRDRLAAGSSDSESERKQLERYESPDQIWRKARELEKKLSSGTYRTVLKPDATDVEKTAWRKENGLPETPKGYKVNMPDGKPAPKEDDAFLNAFLTNAHAGGYTQDMVDATIKVFYAEVDRQQEAMSEAEKKATEEADEKLRQEWGTDYKTNKSMAEALLARAPAGFRDRFMNGYLSDHRPIKASPEAWKWLAQMEREINPAATVVPASVGDQGKAIETELLDLKKMMGNKQSEYWEGPKAEKNQARYRELVAAQQKMAAKKAA
jgi:hypothetical protein